MASPSSTANTSNEQANANHNVLDLMSQLPREKGHVQEEFFQYQGFWYGRQILQGVISLQTNFKPHPTDVLLSSSPKSGTTWFKALTFSVLNRARHQFHAHPLLTTNPHDCVPWLESHASRNPTNPIPNLPLLSTHIAFDSLPPSVLDSGCRIVYTHRDPKDTFVSYWHFLNKVRRKDLPPLRKEEVFEQFCKGVSYFGPFWDHVLGYWKASMEYPERVLFLRYEDMKREPSVQVKRLAEFLGHPFTMEEESEGVVEKIIELCSFDNLRNLEVNKTGELNVCLPPFKFPNNAFFREGKVGDGWKHLSVEMIERINQITEQKFKTFGLI